MSIFETVKQSVTIRQAAERYGIRVEKNGMWQQGSCNSAGTGFCYSV